MATKKSPPSKSTAPARHRTTAASPRSPRPTRSLKAGRAAPLDAGQATIEWLYREQLQIDDEWALRTPRGFRWWAHQHAQTIEVVGEETAPDGDKAYLIAIRTEVLREVDLSGDEVAVLQVPMSLASMAGFVHDAQAQTLDLCSLVRVHGGNLDWMKRQIALAALLQLDEAQAAAPGLAEVLGGTPATSAHPESGPGRTPTR